MNAVSLFGRWFQEMRLRSGKGSQGKREANDNIKCGNLDLIELTSNWELWEPEWSTQPSTSFVEGGSLILCLRTAGGGLCSLPITSCLPYLHAKWALEV